jgi:hypothetical protein
MDGLAKCEARGGEHVTDPLQDPLQARRLEEVLVVPNRRHRPHIRVDRSGDVMTWRHPQWVDAHAPATPGIDNPNFPPFLKPVLSTKRDQVVVERAVRVDHAYTLPVQDILANERREKARLPLPGEPEYVHVEESLFLAKAKTLAAL